MGNAGTWPNSTKFQMTTLGGTDQGLTGLTEARILSKYNIRASNIALSSNIYSSLHSERFLKLEYCIFEFLEACRRMCDVYGFVTMYDNIRYAYVQHISLSIRPVYFQIQLFFHFLPFHFSPLGLGGRHQYGNRTLFGSGRPSPPPL